MSIKDRTAKIEHICSACQQTIRIGDEYEDHKTLVWDSDQDYFETMRGKRCMKCADAGVTPWMHEKGRVFV